MTLLNLQNQFLIAPPSGNDSYFHKAVIYICEHTAKGAMGVVINQPMNITILDLLKHMELIEEETDMKALPSQLQQFIFAGGPLQRERGFVLHQPVGEWQSSFSTNETMGVTTSRDVLQAMIEGKGPEHVLIALGYTGWEAGQLEDEMARNFWLCCPADNQILFNVPVEQRWEAAGRLLGIDLNSFPSVVGHA